MTSDEFKSKYRLLKQIAAGGGRSYTAQHCATGRAVLVHFADEELTRAEGTLGALLFRLNPRDRSKVVETMTVDRSLVVVTQFLEGFETFEKWLRSRAEMPDAPADAPPASTPPQPAAGEFTQLFHAAGDSAATEHGGPATPAASRPNLAPAPVPRPPGHPAPAPPPASPNFTELFRGPVGPAPSPTRSDSEPGPLPIIGVRLPPRPLLSGPDLPPAPPKLTPNLEAAAPPPEPLDLPRLGNFLLDAPAPAGPVQPAPPAWGAGAASEFTRQLSRSPRVSSAPPEVVGGAEPVPPTAPPARSYVPLLLALNLVLIVVLALGLYFALRR
jgi:hypothetical protein